MSSRETDGCTLEDDGTGPRVRPGDSRGLRVHLSCLYRLTGLLTVEGWRAIILPAITLALFQMTFIMRLVRAEMIEVLRTGSSNPPKNNQ